MAGDMGTMLLVRGRFFFPLLAGLLTWLGAANAAQTRFPVLRAGGVSYSNVIVTGTSARDVFIRHSGGLGSVKVADLDPKVREALGLPAPREVAKNTGLPGLPGLTGARAADEPGTNGPRGLVGVLTEIGRAG